MITLCPKPVEAGREREPLVETDFLEGEAGEVEEEDETVEMMVDDELRLPEPRARGEEEEEEEVVVVVDST